MSKLNGGKRQRIGELIDRRLIVGTIVLVGAFGVCEIVVELLARARGMGDLTEDVVKMCLVALLAIPTFMTVHRAFHLRFVRNIVYAALSCIVLYSALDLVDEFESLAAFPLFDRENIWHIALRHILSTGAGMLLFVASILLLLSFDRVQTEMRVSSEKLEAEVAKRREAEQVLHSINEATSSVVGADFFASLVRNLAQTLGIKYVFVGVPYAQAKFRTIVFWADDNIAEDFDCDARGGPCEQTLSGRVTFFPQDVQESFPDTGELKMLGAQSYLGFPLLDDDKEVLGHLCLIDDKPMAEDLRDLPAIRFLASRAAAELERMRQEERLRLSEFTRRALLEGVPDQVYQVRNDGIIVDYHRGNAGDSGVEGAELIGLSISTVAPPEGRKAAQEAIENALTTQKVQSFEFSADVQGTRSHFHARVMPISSSEVVLVSRDVSDLKESESQRRELEGKFWQVQRLESLSILAGGIAHDFNNLLTGVLGNASLALSKVDAGSPVRTYLNQIQSASHRAADLSRQMLAYSGKGQFVVEPVCLSALCREIAKLACVSLPKGIDFELDLNEKTPATIVDSAQLTQVVLNLVTNAGEAIGGDGGTIHLRTGAVDLSRKELSQTFVDDNLPAGDYVFLEVSDDGPGMSEETRSRVFDPFFTTKFPGRGLGLASVIGIVRGHDGAMSVESAPGKGTTFRVLLPASAESVEPAACDETMVDWNTDQTILIADDEETVLAVARDVLESCGATVVTAADSKALLSAFGENPGNFGVVLLDVTMPYADVDATVSELRSIREDITIVLMSGYTEREIENLSEPRAIAGFVQKPFSPASLVRCLAEALEGTPQFDQPR